jgi:hypothetical protein
MVELKTGDPPMRDINVQIAELRRLRTDPGIVLVGLADIDDDRSIRYIDLTKSRFNEIFDPQKDVYRLSDFLRRDSDGHGEFACV